MLIELKVKNLGIIQETVWHLQNGLNVITGETGAGKSLVIDAVEALLGGRVEESDIRSGTDEAQIEGIFDLPQGAAASSIKALLDEKGIPVEDEPLIISCAIRRKGRSVFRINANAVPKSTVGQIGRIITDIQGQSQHLALLEPKYHLDLLDAFGGTVHLRGQFGQKVSALHETQKALSAIEEDDHQKARREEFLNFAVSEIESAGLKEGQEEELQQEKQVLASAEKLKSLSYIAYQILSGDESSHATPSTLDGLNEAASLMRELAAIDTTQEPTASFLEETSYSLQEATADIRQYSENMEYDPQRLAEIENSLQRLSDLKRKYGNTIGEILNFLTKSSHELGQLSSSSQRRQSLEEKASSTKREMGIVAAELSQRRAQTAKEMILRVRRELDELNMPQVQFQIAITPTQNGETIPLPDGRDCAFDVTGIDCLEFMASTNPGEPLKPLAKIASTGEISRFMLALKSALSQADDTPVVIFDEIDIGVGGRNGEILGRKLWNLARNRQVICITHLPQIAAFADAHYSVRKQTSNERTTSLLQMLDEHSRLNELAAMYAGPDPTKTSINSASELLHRAADWKKNS